MGVRSPEGETLSIKDSFLIAVYAKTLFAIIGSVNASLGYIISSFWVSMISIVFVMSYMFKAEVSVLPLRENGSRGTKKTYVRNIAAVLS